MSYHDEQETLDSLKHWWTRWGNLLTWAMLVALIVLAGYNGWQYWQRRQTAQAAVLYDLVQQAVTANDRARITQASSDMEDKFGGTPYAQMTALVAAKALYGGGDAAGAKRQLQWAIDHAHDDEYKQLARLRLAGLLLDEKAYDAGLAVLQDSPSDAFKALFADRRGDLLAAQGKTDAARTAYRAALAAIATGSASNGQLVQFKLDALGG